MDESGSRDRHLGVARRSSVPLTLAVGDDTSWPGGER